MSTIKDIDSTVFTSFDKVTSDKPDDRNNGCLTLLQHLGQSGESTKEQDYAVGRLIRGLGASSRSSRSGFFAAFIGFLKSTPTISIQKLYDVMEKQLHVGTEINNKEDSDALVGHILLCAALIRSDRLLDGTPDEISKCTAILVNGSKHKKFHAALAYSFICELMQLLSSDTFTAAVWPILKKELQRPWEKHNINTVYCLLTMHERYATLVDSKYLEKSLKTPEIFAPQSYKHFGRIFWGNTSAGAITHPAYDAFGRYLQSAGATDIVQFWSSEVSETLAAPNKIKEVVTLKMLTDLLNGNKQLVDHPAVTVKLLNKRFIKMIVSSLKHSKKQRHAYVTEFYDEFFEALCNYIGRINSDDTAAMRTEILLKFISPPHGIVMIEKYTTHNIVHQMVTKLDEAGVIKVADFYRKCLLSSTSNTNETDDRAITSSATTYTHAEKQHVAQMLQHLLNQQVARKNTEWRSEMLKFLIGTGVFYCDGNGAPVKKSHDAGTVTKDLAVTIKSAFFSSLQPKSINLKDEKRLLFDVATFVNGILHHKSAAKFLRNGVASEKMIASWKVMFEAISKSPSGKDKKLALTFHILFLHMGFQLFREPAMADIAIKDLLKCLANTSTKKRAATDCEPEWIEVVVDLFLHLMSHNVSFLRNVVDSIFPNFCANLTMTSVHQILSVLDMKDGKNPLSRGGEDNDSSSDEDDEKMDIEDDDEKSSIDSMSAAGDEEGTVPEQLRTAVSTALGSAMPETTDTESIDLNDMTDADAERLDAALSAAFQLNKKPNSKKKTKEERTSHTTVMHFRIRVLDLIDIYVKTNPTLAISLEIILALFAMIEHSSADPDSKSLTSKVDRVLRRLLAIRKFESVADVTEDTLTQMLKSLFDKRVNLVTDTNHNQRLSKFYQFCISSAQSLPSEQSAAVELSVLALTNDYLMDFIQSRNPIVEFSVLQDIFRGRWFGIWKLGKTLAKAALNVSVRTYRRAQSMELLILLYKNQGFIKHEIEQFNAATKSIEKAIDKYLNVVEKMDNLSAKEFSSLVALLLEVYKCHTMPTVRASVFEWKRVGDRIQTIRKGVLLVSLIAYKRFCQCLAIKMQKNMTGKEATNGQVMVTKTNSTSDETTHELETADGAEDKNKQMKRKKTIESDGKKEKRLKKEERLRISSEGFDGIRFSKNGVNEQETNGHSNSDSDSG